MISGEHGCGDICRLSNDSSNQTVIADGEVCCGCSL